MSAIYFCSTNPSKREDVKHVFAGSARPVRVLALRDLVEPLSSDLDVVVRQKAMTAYRRALVPLFVEHGSLHIDHLRGLPGPMAKIFWETLDDRLCQIIPADARSAHQIQKVCYCDGQTLQVYTGRVEGVIADAPRGEGGIHWEQVFVPEGHTQTFGEMTRAQRLARSASATAFADLKAYLGI